MRNVLAQCNFTASVHVARHRRSRPFLSAGHHNRRANTLSGLVLLDFDLPGVPGIEVLTQIRSSPRCSRIPVIVITSSESEEDRRAVLKLHADAYCPKPASRSGYLELAHVIHRVLGTREKAGVEHQVKPEPRAPWVAAIPLPTVGM
jgi:CheY-like chemotaxis protein